MMFHVFKRRLAFLMLCMVLAGVLTPATTFAKSHSSPGERHHSRAIHPLVADAPIPITVDCSAPLSDQVIADFQPADMMRKLSADQVTITVRLTSDDTGEADEHEALVLHETKGNFNPSPIEIPSNPNVTTQTFPTFTASSTPGDQLTACINGADDDDQVTVTVNTQSCARPQSGPGPFNSCVNTDPNDTTTSQRETSVAVSSVNSPGTTVMVEYNDTTNSDPKKSEGIGYSVSYDGGTRWEDKGALPHPSDWENVGDPALTVDRNGTFYFAHITAKPKPGISGILGGQETIISLSRCTDSRKTGIDCSPQNGWPTQVSDTSSDTEKIVNDKPGIAYDPVKNRVYVTWTRFSSSSTTIKLRYYDVSTSTPKPSKEYNLYTTNSFASASGSYPVVTRDGLVHVFFETGLDTDTGRSISYVKFKNGIISHLFDLASVSPSGEQIDCGTPDALDTQIFSGNPARTNDFPIATVDKDGNIDVVWNAGPPLGGGGGAGASIIWVATLKSGTDTPHIQILPDGSTNTPDHNLLIQWQPTVAVAGGTNTLVVTYFQVVQDNDGNYWLERDQVRASASSAPTFSPASLISTHLSKPDSQTQKCDMGDYTGSASTSTANVVWVYRADSRDYTTGRGPQPDIFGLFV